MMTIPMHIQEVVLNAVIPVKLFGVTPGGIPPRTLLRRGRRPLPRRLPKPSTIVCCLPAMRVRGSASVRRCSLARSHGALRADRPRSAPVAKVPSVRSGVPFTVEDARKPLEPTVPVGRENVKPMCHASLPPQGDPFDRIRTSFPRKRDPLWRRREFLKREDLSGTDGECTKRHAGRRAAEKPPSPAAPARSKEVIWLILPVAYARLKD